MRINKVQCDGCQHQSDASPSTPGKLPPCWHRVTINDHAGTFRGGIDLCPKCIHTLEILANEKSIRKHEPRDKHGWSGN